MNEEIDVLEVRLINADGEQAGIVSIEEALSAATAAGLDLVEISPDAEPPVCKVMDYGKKLFEAKNSRLLSVRSRSRPRLRK